MNFLSDDYTPPPELAAAFEAGRQAERQRAATAEQQPIVIRAREAHAAYLAACERASTASMVLSIADGQGAPDAEIRKLQAAADAAWQHRQSSFHAWMTAELQ